MSSAHVPPLLATLISLLLSQAASAAPTITIANVPAYGVNGFVTGSASGVDFTTHLVATYIQIEGAGWWIKPTSLAPTVALDPNGSFSVDVATGGLDNRATIYCVALIEATHTPPDAQGAAGIPTSLESVAVDCQERYARTFSFAGRVWAVKEAPDPVGPGANRFSDRSEDVFVDGDGLHLTLRLRDGQWWSTEVILLESLGPGTYTFRTSSRLDDLDANLVFGAFTWDAYGDETSVPGAPHREIDSEDSRWGIAADPTHSQFVVQPFGVAGNLNRYSLPDQNIDASLTRSFTWEPSRIRFVALDGYPPVPGYAPSSVIASFDYAHDPGAGHFVPSAGRERFRFNLWLLAGAPVGPGPFEVVIRDFAYTAPAAIPAVDRSLLGLIALLLAAGGVRVIGARERRGRVPGAVDGTRTRNFRRDRPVL